MRRLFIIGILWSVAVPVAAQFPEIEEPYPANLRAEAPGEEVELHIGPCERTFEAAALYRSAAHHWLAHYTPTAAERALESLAQAGRLCPAFVETRVLECSILYQQVEWIDIEDEEAREEKIRLGEFACDKALEIDPDSMSALFWRTVQLGAQLELDGWFSSLFQFGTLKENLGRVYRESPHYYYGGVARYWVGIMNRVPLWGASLVGYDVQIVIDMVDKDIAQTPECFINYVMSARLLKRMDQEEQAVRRLRFVLESDPAIFPVRVGEQRYWRRKARELWREWYEKDWPAR